MKLRNLFPGPPRGGLVVNSVLLSVLLVVATAACIGAVVVLAMDRQIEQAADRRLADGSVFFQSEMDDTREDLMATGTWLSSDRQLVTALAEGRLPGVQERMALALRLHAVDEVVVADTRGEVIAQLRVEPGAVARNIARASGFRQALAGRPASGIAREDEEFLRQVVYLPVLSPDGSQTAAVIRVASFLGEEDLDQFRANSGLEASLFFDRTRVVTTLRQPSGLRMVEIGPDPLVYRQVAEAGSSLVAWRDLPTGQFRSYYAPLVGPDGSRVGMISVALPVTAMTVQLRETLLPVLPVTLAVVLGSALTARFLARKLRGPVLLLAGAATRLSQGDLSTPMPAISERELAPIAEQLEQARRNIKGSLETIARQEGRQRAIIAALQEPVLMATPSARITEINRASAALFGSPAHIIGRPIGDILPFVPAPDPGAGGLERWQGTILGLNGVQLDLEVTCTRLEEAQLPAGLVYVVHDVSKHAELSRLREQLLYDFSHELRSPLAALDNSLEVLSVEYAELSAEEFGHLLESARRVAGRLRGIMDNLLSAGAIQSGRFVIHCNPAELQPIIDEAVESVGAMCKLRGQRLTVEMPVGLPRILADPRTLVQALSNLLSNASKYGPDGEAISLRASREGAFVKVTVEDRGPGVPPEARLHLFDRFYRIDRGQSGFGVGLGLAIVKGIVEAHGGQVGLDGVENPGTRIWFTVPVAEAS